MANRRLLSPVIGRLVQNLNGAMRPPRPRRYKQ